MLDFSKLRGGPGGWQQTSTGRRSIHRSLAHWRPIAAAVDIAQCRPPYGSNPPVFGLDAATVEAACEAVGATTIWSSCATFMGDFARYIIESRTRDITKVLLTEPAPARTGRLPDREMVKIDKAQAQLWATQRVLELGWTKATFPYDRSYHTDRTAGARTERIGKKYQWIAYHELLARLADNFWLAADYDDGPARKYDTPRDLEFTRDIDPTLPDGERDLAENSWVVAAPPLLPITEVAPNEMESWVLEPAMPRARLDLGNCTDMPSDEWLTLYRYQASRLNWPDNSGYSGAPFRQDDFHFLMMIAVERSKRQQLINTAAAAKIDFHDWLRHDYTDGPYLYELGNRRTWPDEQWIDEDFRHPKITYLSMSHGYLWEWHLDGSQPEGFQLRLPQPWLVHALNLRADPWHPGTFLNPLGQLTIVTRQEDRNNYCLIRRDALEPLAASRDLSLMWAGIGERTGWPDPSQNRGPRRRWNGLMWPIQGGHRHKIWCEDSR